MKFLKSQAISRGYFISKVEKQMNHFIRKNSFINSTILYREIKSRRIYIFRYDAKIEPLFTTLSK